MSIYLEFENEIYGLAWETWSLLSIFPALSIFGFCYPVDKDLAEEHFFLLEEFNNKKFYEKPYFYIRNRIDLIQKINKITEKNLALALLSDCEYVNTFARHLSCKSKNKGV